MIEDLLVVTKYACIKNSKLEFVEVSEAFAEMTGLGSPEEAVGKKDSDFTWSAASAAIRERDIAALKSPGERLHDEDWLWMGDQWRCFLTERWSDENGYLYCSSFETTKENAFSHLIKLIDVERRLLFLGPEYGSGVLEAHELAGLRDFLLSGQEAGGIEAYPDRLGISNLACAFGEVFPALTLTEAAYETKVAQLVLAKKDWFAV